MFKKYLKENKNNRIKYGLLAGIVGIISNLFLGIIKLIIGIISNSISILADAINNISDMASSIVTIIGFKLTNKKPNKQHPYGYARYEYISGLIIAILMLLMGALFTKESISKIISPKELYINKYTFIILIISIIVKIFQMKIYLNFSKLIDSKTLKTTAVDTKNDIISTCTILLSLIIMKIYNINIDGYLGLIVSIFVIYSSIKMLKEVIEPLVGIIPTKEWTDKIKEKLLSYEYVEGIHDLVIHNYGINNDFITVHIEIDSRLNMLEAHDLMDIIENDFKEELQVDLTIHMDPVVIGDKKSDKIKNEIIKSLNKLDESLTIHDFRIVKGKKRIKILFDCVVPYEKNYTAVDIKNHLIKTINNNKYKYYYVIEIDRPFCE